MFDSLSYPIPIPMEDDLVHTDHDPFCSDPTCPCHEDQTLLPAVSDQVKQGLLTTDEATRYVKGEML